MPVRTGVYVQLIGIEKLQRTFSILDFASQQRMKAIIEDSALAIQSNAKRRAPVRKTKYHGGALRRSIFIHFYNNGLTASVGSDMTYAKFVEFGTGRRGAASMPVGATVLVKGGQGYVHGPKRGMLAQPYLYPSLLDEGSNFVRKVREAFGRDLL